MRYNLKVPRNYPNQMVSCAAVEAATSSSSIVDITECFLLQCEIAPHSSKKIYAKIDLRSFIRVCVSMELQIQPTTNI